MQEIWMAGIDWDDVLPNELTIKWEKWVSELPNLSHIAIPRCLRLANPEKVDIFFLMPQKKPSPQVPTWCASIRTTLGLLALSPQSVV